MMPSILYWILLIPALGFLCLLGVPAKNIALMRRIVMWSTFLPLALSLYVYTSYNSFVGGFQFVSKIPWVVPFGISFHLGVDGINCVLLLLLGICSFASVFMKHEIKDRMKEYYLMFMLIIFGSYGAFLSLDIFFFYFFHEIATIPVFLMMGIWGSKNRHKAAMKLTLYLTLGASIALLGLIMLYLNTGLFTFDLPRIIEHLALHPLNVDLQNIIFPLIVLGFGITLTLFPFHTWAPIGYAEAPTPISMLHAGVLKKMGAYAIIRMAIELMPQAAATWMPLVATLAVISIIFCGLVALTQKDIKYILGYSSCSHMGYILLGLACYSVIGLNAVVLLMFAHGIMATLAFALAGYIEQQCRSRELSALGGLAKKLPFIATCLIMVSLASAGVPGFANFAGEILILLSAWDQYQVLAICAILGVVITAIYMLKIIRLALQGPLDPVFNHLQDAKGAVGKFPYVLLLSVLIVVGCFPMLILQQTTSTTQKISALATIKGPVK